VGGRERLLTPIRIGAMGRDVMADESVRIMCPNLLCRKVLAVPQSARGKTVRCRACSTTIRIPSNSATAAAAKPAEGASGSSQVA
jgi:hypothetical protein